MTGLGLPPSVHHRTPSAADILVIPDPGLRVDRLADGTQESQALEIVFTGKFRSPSHEGADRGRCRMKNRHAVFFHDTPETIFIRPIRRPFVHDLSNAVGHGAIDDVRMSCHPADVGGAPEDIVLLYVEDPFVPR